MWLLLACTEPPPLECTASVDPTIPTVIHVTWDAAEDATVHVEHDLGSSTAQTVKAGAVDIPLYGYPEATAVSFRAISSTDAGESRCEGEITTGRFDDAPTFTLAVDDAGQDPDTSYFLGALWSLGTTAGVFIANRAAELVWWLPFDGSHNPFEALWGANATVLANSFNADHAIDDGSIRSWTLLGEELSDQRTVGGHHFFTTVGDDGTLAALVVDVRSWTDPDSGETMDVVGDQILEIAPDGTETTVFSTWDVMEVEKGTDWDLGFYPQGKDWTHANSIKFYPDTDHYLISFNSLRLVLEVERSTGAVVRSFGETTQFDENYVVSSGDSWEHQHDVELEGDELTMFGSANGASGGLRYRIDDAEHALIETERVGFDLGMTTFVLGQNERLGNGDSWLNYATLSSLVEVDPDGHIVWQLDNDSGDFFGNVHPFAEFPG